MTKDFTQTPLVSFLTVNYHQPEVTLQLLQSLQHLTYPNWECIVVNNGGQDPTLEAAIKDIANIKYIETEANLGFAGGNNAGLPLCEGELIYFINNDTEVDAGLLEPMVACFLDNENVGMVSSKILFHEDKRIIQYAGATELNPYTLRNKGIGWGEIDRGQYDYCRPTAFIHGASMMVSSKAIEVVGPMYEDYFLYYEEYDWCQRMKEAGYGIYYCGYARLYHKESVSTGANSPLKTYYLTRNRLLFARRNYQGLRKVISFSYLSFIALPIHLVLKSLRGNFDLARAMIKGYTWNLTHKATSSENRN